MTALKDDAKRAANEARTLADIEVEGFNCVGIYCPRCGGATNLAVNGELRKRNGLTLGELRQKLCCSRCASKRENPERHHDMVLKPLVPNEKWP